MSQQQEIVHAYRHLHKSLLRAVQYSTPTRYVIRDHIRHSFRTNAATDYNPTKVSRTLEFLDHATKYRGREHRILRNILRVWGERKIGAYQKIKPANLPFRKMAYEDFDRTVRLFGETMGLCIK